MSDTGGRPNKRKDLTPEAKQDKDKVGRPNDSINPLHHPSILSLASPTNTQSLNIAQKCQLAGISEAQDPNVDIETVYKLVIDLSTRVSNLEDLLEKKDAEIFNLRRDHANIHQQFNDLRNEKIPISTENTEFLEVVKKELPKLSDHVAANDSKIVNLSNDVKLINEAREEETAEGSNLQDLRDDLNKMKEDVKKISEDKIADDIMNEGGQLPTNNDVHQLIKAQSVSFENHSRRSHLEMDHQSQYTMRDTIRVTGVPYKQGESTNDIICRIAFSLGVHITTGDISVSHRTGKRHQGRPRAIICKFIRRDIKHAILRNKKLARNITQDDEGNPVKIFVDEKLTPMRANVCKLFRDRKVQHHTHDGKIFIHKENSSDFTVLDTPDDWLNWNESVKTKIDCGVFPKF